MYQRACRWVLIAFGLFSFGCAATSQQAVLMAPTFEIGTGQQIYVLVDRSGSRNIDEMEALAREVVQQLDASGAFDLVDARTPDDDREGLLVTCKILKIRRVKREDRVMMGALAGVASVEVQVTVTDTQSQEVLGESTVTGKSSGGTVFAGTTEQAIEKAAEGIADFVTSRE